MLNERSTMRTLGTPSTDLTPAEAREQVLSMVYEPHSVSERLWQAHMAALNGLFQVFRPGIDDKSQHKVDAFLQRVSSLFEMIDRRIPLALSSEHGYVIGTYCREFDQLVGIRVNAPINEKVVTATSLLIGAYARAGYLSLDPDQDYGEAPVGPHISRFYLERAIERGDCLLTAALIDAGASYTHLPLNRKAAPEFGLQSARIIERGDFTTYLTHFMGSGWALDLVAAAVRRRQAREMTAQVDSAAQEANLATAPSLSPSTPSRRRAL